MLLARKVIGLGDKALYTIDLSQWMLGFESLVTVQAEVLPVTVPPLVAEANELEPTLLGVTVTGGVLNETYSVTITYSTEQDTNPGTALRIQNDVIEVSVIEPGES